MIIHPEGTSCGHVRSQLECLFSMTLLRGVRHIAPMGGLDRVQRGGGGRGTQRLDLTVCS